MTDKNHWHHRRLSLDRGKRWLVFQQKGECLPRATLLALPVDGAVAVSEPVEEGGGAVVGDVFGYYIYLLGIKDVACVVLTVLGGYLQFVSATHELNPVSFQLPFQPTPIVACFDIVLLVPHGPHFAVIVESYGLLVSYSARRQIVRV